MTSATLEQAIGLAVRGHAGQTDKVGFPYVLHPLRVMERLRPRCDSSTDLLVVAVLHDLIEDTGIEADDLRREGFGEDIVRAVELLSRPPAGSPGRPTYREYVQGIKEAEGEPGWLAREVKIADLLDNLSRINSLPVKERGIGRRYEDALEVLLEKS